MRDHHTDLNNATFEEISKLPLIGETRAKEIIDHRPFHSWENLKKKVPSINDHLIDLLRTSNVVISEDY